jgi:GWxTD domain-containing protein
MPILNWQLPFFPVDSVIPAPPFSELSSDHDGLAFSHPDTTFTLHFTQGNTILPIEKYGIYRLHVPSDPENGFLIYFYHNQFPYLSFWDDMLLPLRYVSSTEEFNNALNYGDARLAVERFWARISGNPDRSAELIRRYYDRAQQANILFTSLQGRMANRQGYDIHYIWPPRIWFIKLKRVNPGITGKECALHLQGSILSLLKLPIQAIIIYCREILHTELHGISQLTIGEGNRKP